jgi:uncharacterized protein YjbJ (UPF0337 family)
MGEKSDKVSGRIKEAAGDLTDNDHLRRQGRADQASGKVKGVVDDAKDKVEDVVDRVADKVHRS